MASSSARPAILASTALVLFLLLCLGPSAISGNKLRLMLQRREAPAPKKTDLAVENKAQNFPGSLKRQRRQLWDPTWSNTQQGHPQWDPQWYPQSYPPPYQQWYPQSYPPPYQQWDPQSYPPPYQQWDPQSYPPPYQQWDPQSYPPPYQQWDPQSYPPPYQQWDPQSYPPPYQQWDPQSYPQWNQQPPNTGSNRRILEGFWLNDESGREYSDYQSHHNEDAAAGSQSPDSSQEGASDNYDDY